MIHWGLEPGVFMGFRSRSDPIPYGERAFLRACLRKALHDGSFPVHLCNFTNKQKTKSDS